MNYEELLFELELRLVEHRATAKRESYRHYKEEYYDGKYDAFAIALAELRELTEAYK